MWIRQILLAVIGLSSGMAVSAGLFSFIISLGVVSDFADRTHTGDKILLYEEITAIGGIAGNVLYVYQLGLPSIPLLLGIIGLFAGIFVGAWAMALAEILNTFEIFIRRVKLLKYVPYIILSIAVGKGLGALVFFYNGW